MGIEHAFTGLPVTDLDSAIDWYERLFGRPPDMVPHDDEAVWQLAGAAAVYVVRDPARAGSSLLTLIVDDLDERVSALREAGLDPGTVETMGPGRKATLVDADGNAITFAQLTGG